MRNVTNWEFISVIPEGLLRTLQNVMEFIWSILIYKWKFKIFASVCVQFPVSAVSQNCLEPTKLWVLPDLVISIVLNPSKMGYFNEKFHKSFCSWFTLPYQQWEKICLWFFRITGKLLNNLENMCPHTTCIVVG